MVIISSRDMDLRHQEVAVLCCTLSDGDLSGFRDHGTAITELLERRHEPWLRICYIDAEEGASGSTFALIELAEDRVRKTWFLLSHSVHLTHLIAR